MTRNLSLAAAGFAAALLSFACGGASSGTITFTLDAKDCQGGDALEAAQRIEVTISGPGMDDLTASGAASAKSLALPDIPAGKDRVVSVRATNGGDGGTVLAAGRSAPIDVKADQDQPVTIKMAALNRFHQPQSLASGQCSTQQQARAGHAAAAFADGRTLLVGGFEYRSGEGGVAYLDTVELYDPATGEFRSLEPLPHVCGSGTESCERAFATAIVQPLEKNGGERLLLIGGEYRKDGALLARGEALAFDPASEEWTRIGMQVARRHHTATLLPGAGGNVVIIVGGFGNPGEGSTPIPVVDKVELIDPRIVSLTRAGPSAPISRALHGAVAHDGGILIVGGVGGNYGVSNYVLPRSIIKVTSVNATEQTAALTRGVIGPSPVIFGGRHLAVIGGTVPFPTEIAQVHDVLRGLPSFAGSGGTAYAGELIDLGTGSVAARFPLEAKRAFSSVAPMDASRVLVAGGIVEGGGVITGSESAVGLLWEDQSVCVPKNCTYAEECDSGTECVAGQCIKSCSTDAACGAKGACIGGACKADPAVPGHVCTTSTACFTGSECIKGGHSARFWTGGLNPASSALKKARAWAACTRISDDQILVTGGLSEHGNPREDLAIAEIYEIDHAGR